jgi:Leucine-rich repeat (LRR) protein
MSRCQRNLLVPLAPFGERITIQNKCFDVKTLYRWIITDNKSILPGIETEITLTDKQRLIQAYEELPKILNILTRDKLIQIYPNLLQETEIDLRSKGYTDIALGTFNDLPNLRILLLQNNDIKKLLPCIFDNLSRLQILSLNNNQIQELQPGTFNNLPYLTTLDLNNNYISRLYPNTFSILPNLDMLYLDNNQIKELQSDIFANLPYLDHLYLNNN